MKDRPNVPPDISIPARQLEKSISHFSCIKDMYCHKCGLFKGIYDCNSCKSFSYRKIKFNKERK